MIEMLSDNELSRLGLQTIEDGHSLREQVSMSETIGVTLKDDVWCWRMKACPSDVGKLPLKFATSFESSSWSNFRNT
jgi:hypothetical protein